MAELEGFINDPVPKDANKGPCPYEKANWVSKVTFWWMNSLFKTGRRKHLTKDDMYDVISTDQSSVLANRLERVWNDELAESQTKKKEPNFFKSILITFKRECFIYGIFLFFSEGLRILQPYLIGRLIGYFQPGSDVHSTEVYIVAAALVASGVARLVFDPWYFFQAQYLAMRMKAAVGSIIYRKVLKISSLSMHQTTSGQIINYLSTDLEKFNFATETFHFAWAAPLEVVIVMYLIYRNVGAATFFMLPVIVCIVPLQAFLGRLFGILRIEIGARTDRRIHVMNEIIAGMRVIKMYCWEKPFSKVISQLRKTEVKYVWFSSVAKSFNICFYFMSGRLMSVAVFVAAWQWNVTLSTSIVFSTIGWIESLRLAVFLFLFFLVENNVQLWASLKRIQSFLVLEEMHDFRKEDEHSSILYTSDVTAEHAVDMAKMTAVWKTYSDPNSKKKHKTKSKNDKKDIEETKQMLKDGEDMEQVFSLKDIDLKVKKGELIAVVGTVGSGKSSLLMALLGELPATDGHITVNGTIGYIAQQPWVVSGTVKDNIIFGQKVDQEKYDNVMDVCALEKDIEQMSHGDMTLVGERGLLLSGGQKARLTLARTIYKDSDIYLLDDPLGAVDTEVGKHLFNKCICEYLEGKTRILVTHQLQYLKTADRIVAFKEGRIVSIGTYDELMNNSSELSKILTELHSEEEEEEQEKEETKDKKTKENTEKEDMEDEDIETGTVGWRVYRDYIASGFPSVNVPLLLTLIVVTECSLVFGDWHLARWAEFQDVLRMRSILGLQNYNGDPALNSSSQVLSLGCSGGGATCLSINNTYILISTEPPISNVTTSTFDLSRGDPFVHKYIVSVGVYIVAVILMSILFFTTLSIAGKRLHDRMFVKVIGARTRFFDSNPVGRILNRFARDVGLMDDVIPRIAYAVFEISFRIFALTIATCVINPLLLIPLCPVVIFIVFIRQYAVRTTRHLKRIESVTKSPVFSHVSDTLNGLQTIRALNKTKDFIEEFDTYQNRHTLAGFLFLASFRWFSFRSVFAVFVYYIIVVIMSLVLKDVIGITGGLYGLSLTYILLLADPFEFMIRLTAELETLMTSIERITAYTKIEQEAEKTSENPPETAWPKEGQIVFKNLFLKYSESSPFVLKDLNCTIQGKEKIGIVGRTGAGKSSMLASLLRLAEPTGSILVDGVDILTIGLHELRAKVSVIPQDPILFSGTLRQNLDPFEEYEDEKLWSSLEQVQLKTKVEGMPGQLYAEMSEGGKNFSVGQRQLVCLARAVLHFNKILILDEATANVDHKTDELIQKTIRERFQSCTVMTVAHRLNTIMDSDRVMVLDNGQLKEFDAPHKLLQNKDGYFRKLVDQTGKAQAQLLQSMAEESYTNSTMEHS